MNNTSKYNYSEDLYDTSSLLFIYDDVLFSHTSDVSVLSQQGNILQDKVAPNKDVRVSSQCEKPNPRRWETVKSVAPSFDLPNLVRLDENLDGFDDSYDD